MKQERARFPSGLAAVYGLVSLALAGLVALLLPELEVSVWGLVLLAAVLLLSVLAVETGAMGRILRGRRARIGSNTAVMVMAALGITVLVNLVAMQAVWRMDLTAEGRFMLSPESIAVLQRLGREVEVLGFFPQDASFDARREAFRSLLDEYRRHSSFLKARVVDPESEPALAQAHGIQRYGTLAFISGKAQRLVERIDEQAFTTALLEVTGGRSKQICFLTGHGERDLESGATGGFSRAVEGLSSGLFLVRRVELGLGGPVPAQCAVVVLAGSSRAFQPGELAALGAYLRAHGNLLLLADPPVDRGLAGLLTQWGVALPEGIVSDEGVHLGAEPQTPAVPRGTYPPLRITRGLDTTYFPGVGAVLPAPGMGTAASAAQPTGGWPGKPLQQGGVAVLPLLLSSPVARLERVGPEQSPPRLAATSGSLALGAVVIASAPLGGTAEPAVTLSGGTSAGATETPLTRIVVIADSDFATNVHIYHGGNGDLFLNAVRWLAEEVELVSVAHKPLAVSRLVISEDSMWRMRVLAGAVVPLCFALAGGLIWWWRR